LGDWAERANYRAIKSPHGSHAARESRSSFLFRLSPDFQSVIGSCRGYDVLCMLRDNWFHYSQWISGIHLKWQTEDFRRASANLKIEIGLCQLRCNRGLVTMHDAVLPGLDKELEGCKVLLALDIEDAQNPDWSFLGHFGVVLINDINYYLRCLITISRNGRKGANFVEHIYRQIERLYDGNQRSIDTVCIRFHHSVLYRS
jgi:hypothetical protein